MIRPSWRTYGYHALILVRKQEQQVNIGVVLMLIVAVFGALDAIIVRQLSPSVHPFIIGFTRSSFGLLAFLPWILSHPEILKSHYRFRHVLRAAIKLASLIALFAAYAVSPLADVAAIAFTAPLFVTIGAWIFLSESPQSLRILAVAIGFAGVYVVLQPGQQSGISVGLWLALLGAILTALIQLILKPMSARDSTPTLVAWNLIVTVPLAAIPAYFVWQMPTMSEWVLLAVQGVIGALSMAMITRAFALADASLISPIDFLRLPLIAILAYWIFGQEFEPTTWIGGALIFAATLLMARSSRT